MKKKQVTKLVKRVLSKNTALDGRTADQIAQNVLADGMVSRTEKRFIRGLIKSEKLDNSAKVSLERVLLQGS